MYTLITVSVAVLVLVVLFISVLSRYRRCPPNKVLVIFGKVGKGQSARCLTGGAAFVWPIINDFAFMDLAPLQVDVELDNALSKQNIRVKVPSTYTIGISTKPEILQAAAERLLGTDRKGIMTLAQEIIIGQARLVVATMDIEEINADRDKFLTNISKCVELELEKVGLRLINVNIKDIQDESGYLQALGKRAAAQAINNAKVEVSQKDRDGAVGEAEAVKDKNIKVAVATADSESGKANADQTRRVNMANANATAVQGENLAQVNIANSTSDMRQKKAEAERLAVAAEKVAQAKALTEAYTAEKTAEEARGEREYATKSADVIVQQKIEKEKIVIDAQAEKEKLTLEAEGQANAIFAKMEAEARGIKEILTKQAEGLQEIVKAAGGDPKAAATLLIIDKLPELVKTQVEAIKGVKIDKVTVWDNGGNGGNGMTSTAGFLSGLMKSVPPLQNLFDMAGMSLPEILGKKKEISSPAPEGK